MNTGEGSIEAKLWLLERIIKNLYEAREIEYRFHDENEDNIFDTHGYITIKRVDKHNYPQICEICDSGLNGEIKPSLAERPQWLQDAGLDPIEAVLDYEIWFSHDPYKTIEKLDARIKELEQDEA